jgi:predicted RNA binding protein YcfA (HicA-like mRNA interferase family)
MKWCASFRWRSLLVPKLPGVKVNDAVRAFEKAGFWIARQSGHVIMTNGQVTITIPRGNPINAFTMAGIVIKSGMTIEQFRKLL